MPNKAIIDIKKWCQKYPILNDLIAYRETTWINPQIEKSSTVLQKIDVRNIDIDEAADRLDRFRPFIANSFPETQADGGLIESPLLQIPEMQQDLSNRFDTELSGQLLLKCDNLLAISGSIKARGGIYEVLKYAEHIAFTNNIIGPTENYAKLAGDHARGVFSNHRIAVGSTGNLGLSIGIMGAQFGFRVSVHMSAEARDWKKKLLKSHGVTVIQYDGDYSQAVAGGRVQAEKDPHCHFIDDENSIDLFLGYAVAARRLQKQLTEMGVIVDKQHPLFVYMPCGVGGGPGGITFGLKHIFGDNVHCFFAEPTHSPCMLLGLCTGLHEKVSVRDFGLDNATDADGLAVSRPSGFIGKVIGPLINGVFTVADSELFRLLARLSDTEGVRMEPSALAGLAGPARIHSSDFYLESHKLKDTMAAATHIVWGTGGSMVPTQEMDGYYHKGKALLNSSLSGNNIKRNFSGNP